MQMFLLLVLPLTALGLVVIFASLRLHENAMRSLVAERDQRTAQTVADALARQLSHRTNVLQDLASRVAGGEDPTDILASSPFIYNDFDLGVAVFSSEGRLVATRTNSEWLKQFLDNESKSSQSVTALGKLRPFLVQTLYDSGLKEFIGVGTARVDQNSPFVVGIFSLSFVEETITDAFPLGIHASARVVDQSWQVIFQSGNLAIPEETIRQVAAGALTGVSGTDSLISEGQEILIVFDPISPIGWAFIYGESWESVSNPLLRFTQSAPLLLVPVVLLALLALWFEARQIIQPLKKLGTEAAALSWGDYEQINEPVGGIAEIGRLQQELIHLSDKVQQSQGGLRNYIGAIITGQEEERRRLSSDLHDDTIQSLIALNQRVQLAQLSTSEAKMSGHLAEIGSLLDQTIKDLRRVIRALRPLYLEDLGLAAALDMLCRESSQIYAFPIDFHVSGTEIRFPPEFELAFYRIAQEGLSNISRHAQAKRASVSLEFAPSVIKLLIHDDGQGFPVPQSLTELAPGGHFGLVGIREKAERMGASFEIDSVPGEGTVLTISLPLAPGPEA